MKNSIKLSMPKYDANKMSGMSYDYVKLSYKLLCDGAAVETTDNQGTKGLWKVIISGDKFRMCFSKATENNALDMMRYGNSTWSARVVDANGNQVMYSSSCDDAVIKSVGKLIEDVRVDERKANEKASYEALEEYIK